MRTLAESLRLISMTMRKPLLELSGILRGRGKPSKSWKSGKRTSTCLRQPCSAIKRQDLWLVTGSIALQNAMGARL
jgi:hypothetical protein